MNIFVLDRNPRIAAEMMCDKHVIKMIVETAQILSSVRHKNGLSAPYKLTHKNHPCIIWAETSQQNYNWLLYHGICLCIEYSLRYKKIHKTEKYLLTELSCPSNIPNVGLTEFCQVMPEEYRDVDVVRAYKRFYLKEKSSFTKWKLGNQPRWFTEQNIYLEE